MKGKKLFIIFMFIIGLIMSIIMISVTASHNNTYQLISNGLI